MVTDPAERRRGGTPEAPGDRDRDPRRLVLVEPAEIGAGSRALDQHRATSVVSTEQTHGTLPGPQRERVRLLVGLVVVGRRHLQHGSGSGGSDEPETCQRKRRSQLDVPLLCHFVRDRGERRRLGDSRLLRDFDCPRLPDHGHLDLARVLELVLDLPRDLVRQERGAVVVDLGGLDDHPDLATGL